MNRIDLSKPLGAIIVYDKKITQLTDEEIAEIKNLIILRKAIFFKNQFLSVDEMKEIGARFSSSGKEPMYQEIDNVENYNYGEVWHGDRAYTTDIPNYTIFQIDQLPTESMTGDTMFINTSSLFRACFSEPFKNMLRTLTVTNQDATIETVSNTIVGPMVSYHPRMRAVHPLVLKTTYEDTILESIYVSLAHTIKINELSFRESRSVINHILEILDTADEHKYRHRWNEGDLVIWSNRVCFHKGVRDFQPSDKRKSKRIMVW